jgi:hypothetical protein
MLARIGGGNSGIIEYLEKGRKQGRELTRDELDTRVILDGDLRLTEHVIDSIPDKGQERYLHITLSFFESEVSNERLQEITQDYKDLLMSAYHSDEFCFYAEAHLPKVKNIIDNRTGEMIERKPHIHIVIPERNLVTGNVLNPRGRGELHIDKLDAIQEHINNKYGLVSPKDGVRVSDHNHANVLARTKGDLFHEKQGDLKKEIFERLDKDSIRSEKEFLNMLKDFGETKVYNKGKDNQYFGFKPVGQTKFTRLNSPVFTKQYIINRAIPLVKPTPKQIEKRIDEWINKTSLEIKYIHPSSEKIRNDYKNVPADQKISTLKEAKEIYDKKYGLEAGVFKPIQRRISERSLTADTRGFSSTYGEKRLPHMQAGEVVNAVQGMGIEREGQFGADYTNQLNALLRNVQRDNLAEVRQNEQYVRGSMRWSQGNRSERRLVNPISNELASLEPVGKDELALMKEIRTNINPDRFLSFVAAKYNVNPEIHKVSLAKDGSPRFNVDKRNLNASDFLTKHINLSWQESKNDLLQIWENQINDKPYQQVLPYVPLTKEQANVRFSSLKSAKDFVRLTVRELQAEVFSRKKDDLKELQKIKDPVEREVERGFVIFKEITAKERIQELKIEASLEINSIHNHWQPYRDNTMELKKTLSKILNQNIADNTISNGDTNITLKKRIDLNKQFDDFKEKTLKDLIAHKLDDKQIKYLDKDTKETVFTDKGNHLTLSGQPSQDRIAMALEYAQSKYGGVLQLTGTDEFKEACALTAAERGMNVILKPDSYHEMMLERLNALKQEKDNEAKNTIEPEPDSLDHSSESRQSTQQVENDAIPEVNSIEKHTVQPEVDVFSSELDAVNAEKIKDIVSSYEPENSVSHEYGFSFSQDITPTQVYEYLEQKAESLVLPSMPDEAYRIKNDHLYVTIDAIDIQKNDNSRYDVICKAGDKDVIKYKNISDTQVSQLLSANPSYQNDFDARKDEASPVRFVEMKQVTGAALSPANILKNEISNLNELKDNLTIESSKESINNVISMKQSELNNIYGNTLNEIEIMDEDSFKYDGKVVNKVDLIVKPNGKYDLTLTNTTEAEIKQGTLVDKEVIKLENVDKRYIEAALGSNADKILNDNKSGEFKNLDGGRGEKYEPYIVDGRDDIYSAIVEKNIDDTFNIQFEDSENKVVYELKSLTQTEFEKTLGNYANGLKDMRKAEPVKIERLVKGVVSTPVGEAVQKYEQLKVTNHNNHEKLKQAEHDLHKVMAKYTPNHKPDVINDKPKDTDFDMDR